MTARLAAKPVEPDPFVELLADFVIGKLRDLAAYVADGEGCHAMAVVVRFRAGDEGVEAFQPMHEAALYQRVERTVDLQRRAEAVVAQLVEQRVGAERPDRRLQPLKHTQLILGQALARRHRRTFIQVHDLSRYLPPEDGDDSLRFPAYTGS